MRGRDHLELERKFVIPRPRIDASFLPRTSAVRAPGAVHDRRYLSLVLYACTVEAVITPRWCCVGASGGRALVRYQLLVRVRLQRQGETRGKARETSGLPVTVS